MATQVHSGFSFKTHVRSCIFKFVSFSFQRENIELYLKGCESYGLKTQDLFQVNDLYESKNLYMIVDNLYCLGGMVNLKIFPILGWETDQLG